MTKLNRSATEKRAYQALRRAEKTLGDFRCSADAAKEVTATWLLVVKAIEDLERLASQELAAEKVAVA